MPCYKPLKGFTAKGQGRPAFTPQRGQDTLTLLPCGQCIGCRLDHARNWAIRCMHEASEHQDNCFVTLTYAPENLPAYGALVPEHFTKFVKDLKYHLSEVRVNPDTGREKRYWPRLRYFMCGEYGSKLDRPHYHALLFGYWPNDAEFWKETVTGHKLFISPTIEKIWGRGFAPIGSVNYESAGYVARYVMKKAKGDEAFKLDHYERSLPDGTLYYLPPEYARMSRRPGIGKSWFEKYSSDVYPSDEVVVRGKVMKPPRYYDKLLQDDDPDEFDKIKEVRKERGLSRWKESTPKRLAVKEEICQARVSQLQRGYEK